MESTNRFHALTWRATAAALAVLAVSACTVSEQEAPTLAGPSGFALSLTVSAAPQVLPRDGSSMATIHMVVREANGDPKSKQRLRVLADAGSLNTSEVETDANGNATVLYVAPGENTPVSYATVDVIPVDKADFANTNPRSVRILLLGPSVPDESFTYAPTKDIVPYQFVDFDALTPEEGKVRCGSTCTYSWDFGDSRTDQGQAVRHEFTGPGLYTVTLTVTTPSGTFGKSSKAVSVGLPTAPEAIFTVNPSGPAVGDLVVFDGSNSTVGRGAQIESYSWAGLSGGIQTGPVVNAVFGTAGSVTVTLTVRDNLGRSHSVTQTITIVP